MITFEEAVKAKMITFERAAKASLDFIASKTDLEEKSAIVAAAGDTLAELLVKTFWDLMLYGQEKHYKYAEYSFFPVAFELAKVACEDFFEHKGPEGLAESISDLYGEAKENSLKYGFLKEWFEANRKKGEDNADNA